MKNLRIEIQNETMSNVNLDNEEIIDLVNKWCQEYQVNTRVKILCRIKEESSFNCKLVFDSKLSKMKAKLEKDGVTNLLFARLDTFLHSNSKYKDIQLLILVGDVELNNDVKKSHSKKETSLNVLPINPQFSLEQLVLPKERKEEIMNVISLLKNITTIYYDWGFIDVDPVPRSIVNLWGPPGTGKTMCVHAIAHEMNKKILILNYADIESKYVGDAPKNLVSAFDLAEQTDSILFFDEADSFLGKRITNVSHSSDQAINSLRSQMLMELESFHGTVFFATNLHENYDRAFESRILKHIEFLLPDVDCRSILIAKKFPAKAPISDELWDSKLDSIKEDFCQELAKEIEGFSGREIKNCILETLIKAARMDEPYLNRDFIMSSFKESKKNFDAIHEKEKKKKDEIKDSIKKNLRENNFKVIKKNRRVK